MSEPEQSKEYIITENLLKRIELGDYPDIVCPQIRSRPHQAPAPCKTIWCDEHYDLDELKVQHDAAVARKAREDFAKKIYDMCECVPLKEYAPDYDKGFHQAMTLVRLWCTTPQSEQEQPR